MGAHLDLDDVAAGHPQAMQELAALRNDAQLAHDAVRLVKQCRDALAEELAAWCIDPPIAHIKDAHDECVEWLARGAQCRTDGRCQYAIDHGAEGLGHCPSGKCVMARIAA